MQRHIEVLSEGPLGRTLRTTIRPKTNQVTGHQILTSRQITEYQKVDHHIVK